MLKKTALFLSDGFPYCYDIDTRDSGNFFPGGGYDIYLIYRNSGDEVGDDDDGNGDGDDDSDGDITSFNTFASCSWIWIVKAVGPAAKFNNKLWK